MNFLRKDGGVEAPISLSGFFPDCNDSDNDEIISSKENNDQFLQVYEIQTLIINNISLKIRQMAFHVANANMVWPGTFALADFIASRIDNYTDGKILELGSATGALAISLLKLNPLFNIMTSDYDDGGEVEENIAYNFVLNELPIIPHIPYCWGNPWPDLCNNAKFNKNNLNDESNNNNITTTFSTTTTTTTTNDNKNMDNITTSASSFQFIIASDILLYVSSYPKLVHTLNLLFAGGTIKEILMSWNRRISESGIFFQLMKDSQFECIHHGKCIYSFHKN